MQKYNVQTRNLQFKGHSGALLSASLDYPQDINADHLAIMSHCFTCTRQTLTTARVSRGLAQAGIAVLRFDFTGLGQSEGKFEDTDFSSMVQDILCAADFLEQHFQAASFLLGHSMGGTASLAASQQGLPQIKKLVTLASPAAPAHVLHHFGSALPRLQQGQDAEIMVAGQAYPVRPGFIQDVMQYDMKSQMQGCHLPILAVSAGSDEIVSPDNAQQILMLTEGLTTLLEIDSADHLFSDRQQTADMNEAITSWLLG